MSSLDAAPVFPCPYTAGGCPLFNTVQVELPKPQTPSCAGGCSPAPSPHSTDPSLKLRPISPQRASSPTRLPPIDLAASTVSASAREWSEYLEFALQPPTPSGSDLEPLYAPLPQQKRSASVSGLWDIEELVPAEAKKPRFLPPAESLPLPLPTPPPPSHSRSTSESTKVNGVTVPFDPSRASPSSSSEDGVTNEVVTPFISKLNYLLEHPEYEPWIRWDASGTHILIAHTKPRLLEILARYFRHTTIASFVRQLNIYGFKRVTTGSLLSILDSTSLPRTIVVPQSASSNAPSSTSDSPHDTEYETFSASDYSAFHNAHFFKSSLDGSRVCRLGALKPITKERGPRVRSKKAKAEKAAAEEEAKRQRQA
ncbi:hypothetical protein JCM11491_000091 [Sporobolomyces phaffii]